MIIQILLFLLFGAVIGWLAGWIMKNKGSLILNIILGIVGAVVGGTIASIVTTGGFDFGGSFEFSIPNILISIGGACLVILVVRIIRKK